MLLRLLGADTVFLHLLGGVTVLPHLLGVVTTLTHLLGADTVLPHLLGGDTTLTHSTRVVNKLPGGDSCLPVPRVKTPLGDDVNPSPSVTVGGDRLPGRDLNYPVPRVRKPLGDDVNLPAGWSRRVGVSRSNTAARLASWGTLKLNKEVYKYRGYPNLWI